MNFKKGFTLLFAVLVMSLLMAVTFAILNLVVKQLVIASIGKQSQIAFYAADSAAECARYWDERWSAFNPLNPFLDITDPNAINPFSVIRCNGVQVVDVDGNPIKVGGSTVTEEINGETYAINKFYVKFTGALATLPYYAEVVIKKNIATNESILESRGYNSDSDIRQVERAVQVKYLPHKTLCALTPDIMLAVDVSGSICDNVHGTMCPPGTTVTEWELMQQGVKKIADVLNPPNSGRKLGMIMFGHNLIASGFKNLNSSKDSIKSTIESHNHVNAGTNMTAALRVAQYELSDIEPLQMNGNWDDIILPGSTVNPGRNRTPDDYEAGSSNYYPNVVIVLSDGANKGVFCDNPNGCSITCPVGARECRYINTKYQEGQTFTVSYGRYYEVKEEGHTAAIESALKEADAAKAAGTSIYTIGIGTEDDLRDLTCGGYTGYGGVSCAEFLDRGIAGGPSDYGKHQTSANTHYVQYSYTAKTFSDLDDAIELLLACPPLE